MKPFFVLLLCVGCGVGVPPPCGELSADRQFTCSSRPTKSYCVVCYPGSCSDGQQQCYVRTSDNFIFGCDTCGGNSGCFEDDNAAISAWCLGDEPASTKVSYPSCGQLGGGARCVCAQRASDLATRPEEISRAGRQSPECAAYVACNVASGVSRSSFETAFGPNGTCWISSRAAEACTTACVTGLSDLGCGTGKSSGGNVLRPAIGCAPPESGPNRKCCFQKAAGTCICNVPDACLGGTLLDNCNQAHW